MSAYRSVPGKHPWALKHNTFWCASLEYNIAYIYMEADKFTPRNLIGVGACLRHYSVPS